MFVDIGKICVDKRWEEAAQDPDVETEVMKILVPELKKKVEDGLIKLLYAVDCRPTLV